MSEMSLHAPVFSLFERAIASNRLAHAYLFVGPKHVGKTAAIERVAAMMLGVDVSRLIAHPDFTTLVLEMDQKEDRMRTTITLEQVQDLCERVSTRPVSGSRRVAAILDAEHLGHGAANALLKCLEEPASGTYFLLRATDADALPATIVSRTQVVRVPTVSRVALASLLVSRGASRAEADEIVPLAHGCPGRALDLLLHRQSFTTLRDRREFFSDALSRLPGERMPLASTLIPKSSPRATEIATELLDTWESVLRDRLRSVSSLRLEALDAFDAVAAVDRLFESREAMRSNIAPTLALEHIFLHA